MTQDPTVMATVDPATGAVTWHRQADKLRDNAERQYQRVRDNKSLNLEAVRAFMAKIYLQLHDDMEVVARQSGVASQDQVAALNRRVFGVDDLLAKASAADKATVSISLRDAQDRANRIETPGEADSLYQTAVQTGDELLVRAVGSMALTSPGYADLAERYRSDHPTQADAWRQLLEISTPQSVASVFEFVTPMPPELASLRPSEIPALAAQARQIQQSAAGL